MTTRNSIYRIGMRAYAIGLLSAMTLVGCQDSAWDDHYGLQEGGSSENIMEVLAKSGKHNAFVQELKNNQLDELLASDQTYTVWAPTDQAMAAYEADGQTVDHLIKNHICRYLYSAADLADTAYIRVKMLNGKFLDFTRQQSDYYLAGVKSNDGGVRAANGVVYSIDQIAPFYLNIYESICSKDGQTKELARYLQSFDVYTFDAANSTVTGKNESGQLVYDSTFVYSNKYMHSFGDLWLEDSLYTMIVPDDAAWAAGYQQVYPYFRTFGACSSSQLSTINVPTRTYETQDALADSLSEAHTKEAMASSLVFRGKVDPYHAPGDSIDATSGNTFHQPAYLFNGIDETMASNGTIWQTSDWRFRPEDLFLKTIVVEAENTKDRTDAYANVITRSAAATSYADSISEMKYIEVVAANTNVRTQPSVQFTIPNTLAATYRVYCVFAPAEAYATDVAADSTRVNFYLNYVGEDGKMKESAAIKSSVITNGHAMTKMFVAEVTLPYANFSASTFSEKEEQDHDCVRLRVQTNVASNETSKLSRTMRIDRIIFEPVIQ